MIVAANKQLSRSAFFRNIINIGLFNIHKVLQVGPLLKFVGAAWCKRDRRSPERKLLDQMLDKHRILIFGKEGCPFTLQMRQLFSKLGCHFTTVDVDKCCDEKFKRYLVEHTRLSTVPQVFIGGKFIGGAGHVLKKHEKGELKIMICSMDPGCLASARMKYLKKKCNPEYIRPKVKYEPLSSSSLSSSSSSSCPFPPNYDPCAPKKCKPECDLILAKRNQRHLKHHKRRYITTQYKPNACTSCAR